MMTEKQDKESAFFYRSSRNAKEKDKFPEGDNMKEGTCMKEQEVKNKRTYAKKKDGTHRIPYSTRQLI